MAILKKINFGDGVHNIAKTVLTAKEGGVMSVAAPINSVTGEPFTNGDDENANYQYELDVNVDGSTIVKSGNSLAVGTVPATKVSVTDSAGVFTAENVETALKELKDDIANVGGQAKSYTIIKETSETEGATLETNVLEQYKLQQTVNGTNTIVGETIKIYKDRSLANVALNGQNLDFTYNLADGTQSTVSVDVSTFLAESEFVDGLQVTDHVVSVKTGNGLGINSTSKAVEVVIDPTSESFLTVGADGVKLAGVQNAIDNAATNAVAGLDVTDAAVAGQYVSEVSETDGKVSVSRVNVSAAPLNNYTKGSDATAVAASDTINQAISKLENQVDAAKSATTAAINALDVTDTANPGQVVTAVSETDGKVSSTKADFAGITLGGFTQNPNATGDIASTDTLADALNKLENKVDEASAEHSVVEKDSAAAHLTVTPSTAASGQITYTIGESNIASASELTAEVTRAKNAETAIDSAVGLTKDASSETRSFTPTSNYGTGSTSVVNNMQKIDAALKAVSDKADAIKYKVTGTTLEFFGIFEKQTA